MLTDLDTNGIAHFKAMADSNLRLKVRHSTGLTRALSPWGAGAPPSLPVEGALARVDIRGGKLAVISDW